MSSYPPIIDALSQGVWPWSVPLDLPEHVPAHDPVILPGWGEDDIRQYAKINQHGLYIMTDVYCSGDGTKVVRT
jgi:hypothetical protein